MSGLPNGIAEFLAEAGWADGQIEPIPGDASFRRYFRIRRQRETAMLMYAPPPEEDPTPFVHVANWLLEKGMRAPKLFAQDLETGWLLTEDFGDDRMREWLDCNAADETTAYEAAIDTLAALHQKSAGPFEPYDLSTYLREAWLFIEWYVPAMGLTVDGTGFENAWREVLSPVISHQSPDVTVLRDYHAENIMLLDGSPCAPQGLIDFQDALVGHPAYDLVSLLQDARRDVSPELERNMFERYVHAAQPVGDFAADYAILGAQRNAKIVGIFTRLFKRDGKPRYLDLIPRVWGLMERDLRHPDAAPLAEWFDANIPDELRLAGGGTIT